jgi:hypothetical protein
MASATAMPKTEGIRFIGFVWLFAESNNSKSYLYVAKSYPYVGNPYRRLPAWL